MNRFDELREKILPVLMPHGVKRVAVFGSVVRGENTAKSDSEPDACGGSQIKCIEPLDYIELARQTIPVIRQEDLQAQVVSAPNVLYFDREYLFHRP